ncbi:MAG: hypothetical protein Kow0065_07610 [Methylomicrobium sp.]
MRIILVRIPADTSHQDVFRFFEPALKRKFFFKKPTLSKIEILRQYDPDANTYEYHALATIEPDSFAKRVIIRLNRKELNGKRIAVREYYLRSWHNDPRQRHGNSRLKFADRRVADRRRKNLQMLPAEDIRITGHKAFHRLSD